MLTSTPSAVDRLARYGWYILLAALALGLLGGVLSAVEGPVAGAVVGDDPCPDPPCFIPADMTAMPSSAIPGALQLVGYPLAAALGVLGVLAGGRDLARGRRPRAARRLAAVLGPLLVLAGTEAVPHALACPLLPWTCEELTGHGWSIADRWHQLDHGLVGTAPLTALYGLALFRWNPAAARHPR